MIDLTLLDYFSIVIVYTLELFMETTIQKWGNSLAVRIPSNFAKEINLKKGARINIKKEQNKLIIIPKRNKMLLADLLVKINKQNLHKEIDTGEKVGNEIW